MFTIICIFDNRNFFYSYKFMQFILYQIMQVQFYMLVIIIIMLLNNDLNWSSHNMVKLVYILPSNIMAPEGWGFAWICK